MAEDIYYDDVELGDELPSMEREVTDDQVVEFLGKCDNEREPRKARMKRVLEDNALRREVVKKEAMYEMFEHLEYNRQKLASNPFVSLGDGTSRSIIPRAS